MNTFQQFSSWLNGVKDRLWAAVARQPLHFIAALTMLLGLGLGIAAVQVKADPVVASGGSSSGTTSTGTVSTPMVTNLPVSLGLPGTDGPSSGPGAVTPPVQLRLSKAAPGQSFALPTDPTGAGPGTSDEVQTFLDGVNIPPGVGGSQGVPGLLNVAFNGGTPQVTALAAPGDTPDGGGGGGGATPPNGTTGGGGTPGGTINNPSTVTSPVPEPSTYALMTLGLVLLGWRQRRVAAARRD